MPSDRTNGVSVKSYRCRIMFSTEKRKGQAIRIFFFIIFCVISKIVIIFLRQSRNQEMYGDWMSSSHVVVIFSHHCQLIKRSVLWWIWNCWSSPETCFKHFSPSITLNWSSIWFWTENSVFLFSAHNSTPKSHQCAQFRFSARRFCKRFCWVFHCIFYCQVLCNFSCSYGSSLLLSLCINFSYVISSDVSEVENIYDRLNSCKYVADLRHGEARLRVDGHSLLRSFWRFKQLHCCSRKLGDYLSTWTSTWLHQRSDQQSKFPIKVNHNYTESNDKKQ